MRLHNGLSGWAQCDQKGTDKERLKFRVRGDIRKEIEAGVMK